MEEADPEQGEEQPAVEHGGELLLHHPFLDQMRFIQSKFMFSRSVFAFYRVKLSITEASACDCVSDHGEGEDCCCCRPG
jgi:hypothetical protein